MNGPLETQPLTAQFFCPKSAAKSRNVAKTFAKESPSVRVHSSRLLPRLNKRLQPYRVLKS
jgi:hypothetical protein